MKDKVVVITTYWRHSPGGGIRNFVVQLVEELGKLNCAVTVIAREGTDDSQFIVKGSRLIFIIKTFLLLLRLRPQVIHSHGNWYCLFPAALYRKLIPCRLLHTFHTIPEKRFRYRGKKIIQWLVSCCDHVTFVSRSLKTYFLQVEKITCPHPEVTYAGVAPRNITQHKIQAFKTAWNIPDHAVVLLGQALAVHQKKMEGAKILLRCLPQLQKKIPGILLLFTKSGPYENELKKFCTSLSLDRHVIFTGNIPDPSIAVATCRVYTHITLAEGGVSLAVLEAMAAGKPIVATYAGGIPEVVVHGKSGLLVDPQEETICRSIIKLLQDEEYAAYLGNQAKIAARRFTWTDTAAGFYRLYKGNNAAPARQDNSNLIVKY